MMRRESRPLPVRLQSIITVRMQCELPKSKKLFVMASVYQFVPDELRAAAAPGSREEISADALALRSTELQTQIARLELELASTRSPRGAGGELGC